MATNFPTSLDNSTSLPYPSSGNFTNAPSLAGLNDNQNDALIATQTKLGIGASTPTSGKFLTGTGIGTSAWANTVPAGTVVGTSDSQTLTNKTLTSPTISSPVITNATISTDLITGYTTSNTGTVYGIPITTGVINTAGTINGASLVASSVATAAIADGAITPAKLQAGTGTSWTWQSWTPTLTNFTGTVNQAKYIVIGKICNFYIEVTQGATVTGRHTFTLPVTASTAIASTGFGWGMPIARGEILNYGVQAYDAFGGLTNTTTCALGYQLAISNIVAQTPTSATTPMVWVSTSKFWLLGTYETA